MKKIIFGLMVLISSNSFASMDDLFAETFSSNNYSNDTSINGYDDFASEQNSRRQEERLNKIETELEQQKQNKMWSDLEKTLERR